MKFATIASLAFATLASAAPIFKREVGTVTFDDATFEPLELHGLLDGKDYPLKADNDVVTANSNSDNLVVSFLPASSSFMGYQSDDNTKYGHIAYGDKHLTVNSPGKADGQNIQLSDQVSTSDDSSQMLQYWSLDVNEKTVKFLGAPKDAPFETTGPFYPKSIEGDSETPITLTSQTGGQLKLE